MYRCKIDLMELLDGALNSHRPRVSLIMSRTSTWCGGRAFGSVSVAALLTQRYVTIHSHPNLLSPSQSTAAMLQKEMGWLFGLA